MHSVQRLQGVTKDAAEIIPDLGAVKGVGEVELGSASVEAVASGRDFDGLAASLGVFDKSLGVGPRLRGQAIRTGDSAADGPDADFIVAVVYDAGLANSRDERSGEG
ncbi:hypothetical protein HYQ46_004208 [Verticillium longisporum]|nr:hypothetical protein HYQ46_004208 [Verticillium longisporum]